jgi:hypothetical protein
VAGTDPEPDEGPGLTWRQRDARNWSGSWNGKLHGTITADGDRWLAYVRLEDRPGLAPITTVGRYDTVEEAQVAYRRGVGGEVIHADDQGASLGR